ncbi:MAG: hypothetical protein HYU78_06665 [Rhodocyclales bacterium]|nr:hypothetical protein [Rhodocyclales bacterium]
MRKTLLLLGGLLTGMGSSAIADTVLVTSVQGSVGIDAIGAGKTALEPFVRLQEGDRLSLPAGAQVNLVYVGKARLEAWQGAGTVVIGESESKAATGKPQVQVRSIPPEAARQMNRTPGTAPDGRVGMMRMRSIPSHDAVARLEEEYRKMRAQSAGDDILPDVLLLAGLFDLRQYDRVEAELKRIAREYPTNASAQALQDLYAKALAGVRTPPESAPPGK